MSLPTPTYAALIAVAIANAPDERLVLDDVYNFVGRHRRLVPAANDNWRNSVRHNLSLRKCFVKLPRRNNAGKLLSAWWTVTDESLPKTAKEYLLYFRKMRSINPDFTADDCLAAVADPKPKSKPSSQHPSRPAQSGDNPSCSSSSIAEASVSSKPKKSFSIRLRRSKEPAQAPDSGVEGSSPGGTPGSSPPNDDCGTSSSSNRNEFDAVASKSNNVKPLSTTAAANVGFRPTSSRPIRNTAPRRVRSFSIDSDTSDISTNSYDGLVWPMHHDTECSDGCPSSEFSLGDNHTLTNLQCIELLDLHCPPSEFSPYDGTQPVALIQDPSTAFGDCFDDPSASTELHITSNLDITSDIVCLQPVSLVGTPNVCQSAEHSSSFSSCTRSVNGSTETIFTNASSPTHLNEWLTTVDHNESCVSNQMPAAIRARSSSATLHHRVVGDPAPQNGYPSHRHHQHVPYEDTNIRRSSQPIIESSASALDDLSMPDYDRPRSQSTGHAHLRSYRHPPGSYSHHHAQQRWPEPHHAAYIPRMASMLMETQNLPVLQPDDVAFLNMSDIPAESVSDLLTGVPKSNNRSAEQGTPSSYHAGSWHGFAPSGVSF